MFGFLGSLLGGASSLIGSIFGQKQQAENNQAMINEQNFLSSGGNLPGLRKNAEAAGFNPLAVLGQNFGSAPATQVGDIGGGIRSMGQDVERGLQAYADENSKSRQLQNQLLQAQIDSTNMDTMSKARRTFAAPGSPPTLIGHPDKLAQFTRDSFYAGGAQPMYADYYGRHGERVVGLSPEFARSQFGVGAVPSGVAAGAGSAGENINSATDFLSPDVGRAIRNWGLDPGTYTPF